MNQEEERRFHVFGLQRSGTNYLETLIGQNFVCHGKNGGWKHAINPHPLRKYDPEAPLFIIRKNPYKWIESIAIRNRVDYVKRQTKYPANDFSNLPKIFSVGNKHLNPVNMALTWRDWYINWHEKAHPLIKSNSVTVRYEDLLKEKSRIAFLQTLQSRFHYDIRTKDWVNPHKVSMSRDFSEEMVKYYLNETLVPGIFNKEKLQLVNEAIGKDIIEKAGYIVLEQ